MVTEREGEWGGGRIGWIVVTEREGEWGGSRIG